MIVFLSLSEMLANANTKLYLYSTILHLGVRIEPKTRLQIIIIISCFIHTSEPYITSDIGCKSSLSILDKFSLNT
jgi:hypothetical protein